MMGRHLMVPRQQRNHQRATCTIWPLTNQRRTDVHALLNTHRHQSFQPLNRILRRSAVRQHPQVVLHRGTESLCGSSEAVSHSPECRTPLRTCSSECAALAARVGDLGARVRPNSAGCVVRLPCETSPATMIASSGRQVRPVIQAMFLGSSTCMSLIVWSFIPRGLTVMLREEG